MEFEEFVDRHTSVIEQLERQCALAYWQASITGDERDFDRYSELQLTYEKIYTNREEFEYVREVREAGALLAPKLKRTADLLYLRYLGNQIDPSLLKSIVELSTRVENKFSVFRPMVGGEEVTTNEIYRILREETDDGRRREAWEASKKVGAVVLADLERLVRLRNEAAAADGFENYYRMSIELAEQDELELERIFTELDELTREPFLELKAELDAVLAGRYGISPEEIRPWHYVDPYFQDAPQTDECNVDTYYRGRDPVRLARIFYGSIGMPVDDILAASDLYEKAGKNPHAFCTDIDRRGDIRILANVKDDHYWTETMLHELGHGVYDKYVDRSLPYLLRSYPHLCTTEAAAMFFGRLAQHPYWMQAALGLPDDEVRRLEPKLRKYRMMKQVIFSRWCQTMFHFERGLYQDSDQDLNDLWWRTVERYQFVKRPEGRDEPDWAAKIHIVSSPVYYHNYMLGELIASQLHHTVVTEVNGGGEDRIHGDPRIGAYFREVVFRPGNTAPWDEHIELVTGGPLSPRHFVSQFIKETS